uniref:DprA-like DNA processing chain A n=1 Tax=Streptomyces phage Scarif TaxID=3158858 RepID=A0AAU7GZP9_9CAUD
MVRVLVTGSRDWPDKDVVYSALDDAFSKCKGVFVVVHGDCPTGADKYADDWVRSMFAGGYFVKPERHPADWKGPRKRGAGFARNAEMVKLGADICLAFIHNESNGATHCAGLAEKGGIDTRIFRSNTMALPARQIGLPPRPYKRVNEEILLEGAKIIWPNFAGEKRLYNEGGKRNFSIELDEPLAHQLHEMGWNVKDNARKVETGEAQELRYHLPVTVKMDGKRPPRIFVITKSKNRRTQLDEESVGLLDVLEFDLIDLKLSPFNWDVSGKQGVSAYLKLGYFTLHEDPLELKYAHIPLEGEEGVAELENFIDGEVEGDTGWLADEEEYLEVDGGTREIEG